MRNTFPNSRGLPGLWHIWWDLHQGWVEHQAARSARGWGHKTKLHGSLEVGLQSIVCTKMRLNSKSLQLSPLQLGAWSPQRSRVMTAERGQECQSANKIQQVLRGQKFQDFRQWASKKCHSLQHKSGAFFQDKVAWDCPNSFSWCNCQVSLEDLPFNAFSYSILLVFKGT